MVETRTFKVTGPGLMLTSYEQIQEQPATYLTDLQGWDDYSGMDIQTVPALSKAGSYVTSIHASEREVRASFSLLNSGLNLLKVMNTFQVGALGAGMWTLNRSYIDGPVTRSETLRGYASSISWARKMDHGILSVTFKCVNPVKEILINGVPQEGSL